MSTDGVGDGDNELVSPPPRQAGTDTDQTTAPAPVPTAQVRGVFCVLHVTYLGQAQVLSPTQGSPQAQVPPTPTRERSSSSSSNDNNNNSSFPVRGNGNATIGPSPLQAKADKISSGSSIKRQGARGPWRFFSRAATTPTQTPTQTPTPTSPSSSPSTRAPKEEKTAGGKHLHPMIPKADRQRVVDEAVSFCLSHANSTPSPSPSSPTGTVHRHPSITSPTPSSPATPVSPSFHAASARTPPLDHATETASTTANVPVTITVAMDKLEIRHALPSREIITLTSKRSILFCSQGVRSNTAFVLVRQLPNVDKTIVADVFQLPTEQQAQECVVALASSFGVSRTTPLSALPRTSNMEGFEQEKLLEPSKSTQTQQGDKPTSVDTASAFDTSEKESQDQEDGGLDVQVLPSYSVVYHGFAQTAPALSDEVSLWHQTLMLQLTLPPRTRRLRLALGPGAIHLFDSTVTPTTRARPLWSLPAESIVSCTRGRDIRRAHPTHHRPPLPLNVNSTATACGTVTGSTARHHPKAASSNGGMTLAELGGEACVVITGMKADRTAHSFVFKLAEVSHAKSLLARLHDFVLEHTTAPRVKAITELDILFEEIHDLSEEERGKALMHHIDLLPSQLEKLAKKQLQKYAMTSLSANERNSLLLQTILEIKFPKMTNNSNPAANVRIRRLRKTLTASLDDLMASFPSKQKARAGFSSLQMAYVKEASRSLTPPPPMAPQHSESLSQATTSILKIERPRASSAAISTRESNGSFHDGSEQTDSAADDLVSPPSSLFASSPMSLQATTCIQPNCNTEWESREEGTIAALGNGEKQLHTSSKTLTSSIVDQPAASTSKKETQAAKFVAKADIHLDIPESGDDHGVDKEGTKSGSALFSPQHRRYRQRFSFSTHTSTSSFQPPLSPIRRQQRLEGSQDLESSQLSMNSFHGSTTASEGSITSYIYEKVSAHKPHLRTPTRYGSYIDAPSRRSQSRRGSSTTAASSRSDLVRQRWRYAVQQVLLLARMRRQNEQFERERRVAQQRLAEAKNKEAKKKQDELWRQLQADALLHEIQPETLTEALAAGVPDEKRGETWLWWIRTYSAVAAPPYAYLDLLSAPCIYLHAIHIDIDRTLPTHPLFAGKSSPAQLSLLNCMKAYSALDEETGYCQGMSFVCALILLQLPEEDAFDVFVHLMYVAELRELYMPDMMALKRALYVYSRLLQTHTPDVWRHLDAQNVEMFLFATPWFLTMFCTQFDIEFCTVVLDHVLMRGAIGLYCFAVVLMQLAADEILQQSTFEGTLRWLQTGAPAFVKANLHAVVSASLTLRISSEDILGLEDEYNLMTDEDAAFHGNHTELYASKRKLEREVSFLKQHMNSAKSALQSLRTASDMWQERAEAMLGYTKELVALMKASNLAIPAPPTLLASQQQRIKKDATSLSRTNTAELEQKDMDEFLVALHAHVTNTTDVGDPFTRDDAPLANSNDDDDDDDDEQHRISPTPWE